MTENHQLLMDPSLTKHRYSAEIVCLTEPHAIRGVKFESLARCGGILGAALTSFGEPVVSTHPTARVNLDYQRKAERRTEWSVDNWSRLFRPQERPAMTTGRALTAQEVALACDGNAVCGDDVYAQVRDDWLRNFYQEFREDLFRRGVVRADGRFDCNHFTSYFTSLAAVKFFTENFNSSTPARTLAIGEIWYRPGAGPTAHAIVVALTERGRVFLDPQTGGFVTLTPEEWATRSLVKF